MEINKIYQSILNDEFSVKELICILELISQKTEINTISEMARKENKTPNGIIKSNKYLKTQIGKQKMVIKKI